MVFYCKTEMLTVFSNYNHFLFASSLHQGKAVLCPMSGQPIKMNELIDVRFTPLDPSLDRVALLTRQVGLFRYLVYHKLSIRLVFIDKISGTYTEFMIYAILKRFLNNKHHNKYFEIFATNRFFPLLLLFNPFWRNREPCACMGSLRILRIPPTIQRLGCSIPATLSAG